MSSSSSSPSLSLSMSREKADEICKHIKENSGAIFGHKFWECRRACALLVQQKGDRWESRFVAIAKFRVFILHGKSVNSLKIEKSFNIVALRYLELLQQQQQQDNPQQLQFGWEERSAKPSSSVVAAPPMLHILVRFPDDHNANNNSNNDDDGEQEQQHNHHYNSNNRQRCCRTVRELALDMLATLKHYFPDVQRSLAKHFLTISPSLVVDFPALPCSTPELPCRNFRRSYVAFCDWLEQPFRDEVIWDIERIYFVHAQHELDLNDFNHLSAKDIQALIGAVQFSDFFTGISATAQRLQPEHVDALLSLVRRSHSLRSLRLCRCTVPSKDFVSQLAVALSLNPTLPLERLRLGELTIDDRKGLAQLGTLLPQLSALHTLFLTDCALSEKLALALLHALHHGIEMAATDERRRGGHSNNNNGGGGGGIDHASSPATASKSSNKRPPLLHHSSTSSSGARFQLRALNLSGNQLGNGTELAEQLANLVALSDGAMRLLDLGGTAVQLDRLWSALKLGGIGLEVLRLGGCYCSPSSSSSSGRRSGGASAKDSAQVTRELFTAVHSLRELNLSGTHIGPELLQGILDGLSANQCLPTGSLHLCLDSAIVGSSACVSVLEQQIGDCACIGALSLRDNALEHEAFRLLSALGRAAHLRVLDIGGANFFALRAAKKHAPVLAGILAELVKLVNGTEGQHQQQQQGEEEEGPHIEDLSLADARLGPHLSVFLNALGLCGRLKRLDLSNNELGPAGARLLCKSLQLNHALRWLALDRNQIGPDGFAELARALRVNIALDALQTPFSDAAECVVATARVPAERTRFQLQMEEIEQCLERNRKFRTFSPTMDPTVMDHSVQRTMHRLNNCCELYGLDTSGRDAELKKLVFHKIGKLITSDSVAQNDGGGGAFGTNASGDGAAEGEGEKANNVVKHHVVDPGVDQLAERVEHMADVEAERVVHQFVHHLADQEGVQMHARHRQAAIEEQMGTANRRLGAALRDDLAALLDKYKKDFAWSRLFATVHQCLCAEDAEEVFGLLAQEKPAPASSFSSPSLLCSSMRKRRAEMVAFRHNGGGGGGTAQHHRPESAIMPSDDSRLTAADVMAAVLLMSRSVVVSDFAHANSSSDDATHQQQKCDNSLTHLAKHRPKPARLLNRSRIQPTTKAAATTYEQQQQLAANDNNTLWLASASLIANGHVASADFDSGTMPTAVAAVVPTSSSSSVGSAIPNSPCSRHHNDASSATPPPPLPLCIRPIPSSPPAVPPRRERMTAPGVCAADSSPPKTPPRLPPKPPPASPAAGGREADQIDEHDSKLDG